MCYFLQPKQAVCRSSVSSGCQGAMCIPGSLGAGLPYMPGRGRDRGCKPWKPTQACVTHHMRLSGITPEARLAENQRSTAWEGTLESLPISLPATGLQRSSRRQLSSSGPLMPLSKGTWCLHFRKNSCPLPAYFIQSCPRQDLFQPRKQRTQWSPRNRPCHCSHLTLAHFLPA